MGMGMVTAMDRAVGTDIVVIALDRGMKSVGDIIVVRGMNAVRDRDIGIEMSPVGSATKGPVPGTDARDLVDEMVTVVSATPSLKAHRMMTQSIR